MAYFPMCVDLNGARVLLVGSSRAIEDKKEKLRSFGALPERRERLDPADLTADIAMVIAAEQAPEEAQRISRLCRESGIPVNIMDQPELCSFFFPALVTRGDLTVSVSTGGKSPGAAACLASRLEEAIPEEMGEILNRLQQLRRELYATLPREEARAAIRGITQAALDAVM